MIQVNSVKRLTGRRSRVIKDQRLRIEYNKTGQSQGTQVPCESRDAYLDLQFIIFNFS